MAEDRDESDERKAGAEGLGNDEDTEKGEALDEVAAKPTREGDDNDAKDAKDAAKADEASDEDAPAAEAKADAKGDAAKADASQERDEKADASSPPDNDEAKGKPKDKEKGGSGRWWIALLVILVVEFYVYGRNGDIEVCVGKQDVHDFSLVGQERTDENRWKFPRCESRVNLGLRSQYDELVEDATNVACRGATLFRNRGEGPQCVAGEQGWTKQVETSYIWPWDSRYYEHLLWFIFE